MNALLINVYYGCEILNMPTGVDYIIGVTCTIFISDNIIFGDLRKQIHTGLSLLHSKYKLTIKVRINTSQLGSSIYYCSLFCVSSEDIWGVVKISTTPVMGFHIMILVVEFELVPDVTGYDPCSNNVLDSSNSILVDVPS
jgi:hypothetical protein